MVYLLQILAVQVGACKVELDTERSTGPLVLDFLQDRHSIIKLVEKHEGLSL